MSTTKDFDWHLGAIVDGLAIPHGGRAFLIGLMPWSKNTLVRRIKGESGFTVKELHVVAAALNTTPEVIVSQALRNLSGGTTEDGLAILRAEVGTAPISEVATSDNPLDRNTGMSEAPISIDARRVKKANLTEEMARRGRHAANYDPEHTEDDDLRDD